MPRHTKNESAVSFGTRRGGSRGAFTQLLTEYPDIRDQLVWQHVMSTRHGHPKITSTEIHRLFVRALRMKHITDDTYPLNTQDRGYRALCSYLRSLDTSPSKKR